MAKYLLVGLILFLTACNNNGKPNVSNIKVNLEVERFEQAFFKIDSAHLRQGLVFVRNSYPDFYPFYFKNVLGINPADTTNFPGIWNVISSYKALNDSVQKKYPNLDFLKDELTQGFKYVKYYYPEYKVPKIITIIGPLDAWANLGNNKFTPDFITPDYLGISLQFYLGKHFSVYQTQRYIDDIAPPYRSTRFDKEYMSAEAMYVVADDIYPDKSVGRPLIEQMIEKGKQWYLLDHFMPDAPDSVKTGYTTSQLNWIKSNEGNAWGWLVKNADLYTIDPETLQIYLGEGPFTQGMPEQGSPGNLGQWLGWRIVQKYADNHNKKTLQEVLATPAKTLFEESGYKPK